MKLKNTLLGMAMTATLALPATTPALASDTGVQAKTFLDKNRNNWTSGINYWNVPYEDGQILHDLIVKGGFKNILEIGTSTGHSTVWLAWAAAKTGGRVTTIEIDQRRHQQALRNIREAGVEKYVDARLANAHDLVKQLPGPWDFVFQDADKEWYLNYWLDLEAKIAQGGCYTAHNVLRPDSREVVRFLERAKANPRFSTRFDDGGSGEGISITCRTP